MNTNFKHAAALAAVVLVAASCGGEPEAVTYAGQAKAILDKHCVECHTGGGTGVAKSGLRLDSYEAVMQGTRFGPVVVAGSAVTSSLYRLVSGQADPSIRMPHNRAPLAEADIEALKNWIDQGARKE
jgi:mono/diheme cytochrome c family protein